MNLPFFFFVSLVSYARGMAATFVHVPLRLPFYLWLRLFPSCESTVVYLPRLLCRKSLAMVISVKCESAAPRRSVTFSPDLFQKIFALDCLRFILLRGKLMALHFRDEVIFWRLVAEIFLELLIGWSYNV